MTDSDFLNWIADRFVHVYGESENVDFVQRLRRIAAPRCGVKFRPRAKPCERERGHSGTHLSLKSESASWCP